LIPFLVVLFLYTAVLFYKEEKSGIRKEESFLITGSRENGGKFSLNSKGLCAHFSVDSLASLVNQKELLLLKKWGTKN
jgi:hypothetical protein